MPNAGNGEYLIEISCTHRESLIWPLFYLGEDLSMCVCVCALVIQIFNAFSTEMIIIRLINGAETTTLKDWPCVYVSVHACFFVVHTLQFTNYTEEIM